MGETVVRESVSSSSSAVATLFDPGASVEGASDADNSVSVSSSSVSVWSVVGASIVGTIVAETS